MTVDYEDENGTVHTALVIARRQGTRRDLAVVMRGPRSAVLLVKEDVPQGQGPGKWRPEQGTP